MAGTLVIDTLKASSGVLATQNGMTGIAKAWVNFNGTAASPTPAAQMNISSITKNAAGDYTIAFSTAMVSSGYSVSGGALATNNAGTFTGVSVKYGTTLSTTGFSFTVKNDAGTSVDSSIVFVQIHGA